MKASKWFQTGKLVILGNDSLELDTSIEFDSSRRIMQLNTGREMRLNVYNSEFYALNLSGIQILLPKID